MNTSKDNPAASGANDHSGTRMEDEATATVTQILNTTFPPSADSDSPDNFSTPTLKLKFDFSDSSTKSKKGCRSLAESFQKDPTNSANIKDYFKRKLATDFDLEDRTARRSKKTARSPTTDFQMDPSAPTFAFPPAHAQDSHATEQVQHESDQNSLLVDFLNELRSTRAEDLARQEELHNSLRSTINKEFRSIREELRTTQRECEEKWGSMASVITTLQAGQKSTANDLADLRRECDNNREAMAAQINELKRGRSASESRVNSLLASDMEAHSRYSRRCNIVVKGLPLSSQQPGVTLMNFLRVKFGYTGQLQNVHPR